MLSCLAMMLAAQTGPAVTVNLTPKIPDAKESVRWSPKGAAVTLKPVDGGLVGSFPLGLKGTKPVTVRLTKSEGAARYDELWVDLNRDGKESADEKQTTTPNERNGSWWSSFNQAIVPVAIPGEAGKPATSRPYPISLWFVEDPREPNATPTLRWSRRGWHEGTVNLDGKTAYVMVTEMNMDGVFDQRDSWFLARDRTSLLGTSSRSMEDHAWLDGVAYRISKIDPSGRNISFASYDPGVTEAEEKQTRDAYAADKAAPKAEKPVAFLHDYNAALAQAKKEGKPLFVDFEATWCGPCKTMDQLVYTSQSVVDVSKGVIAVKVDGDVHYDLAKKMEVGAYPTLILFDASGKEIRRAVGYRSVAQMTEFLKP